MGMEMKLYRGIIPWQPELWSPTASFQPDSTSPSVSANSDRWSIPSNSIEMLITVTAVGSLILLTFLVDCKGQRLYFVLHSIDHCHLPELRYLPRLPYRCWRLLSSGLSSKEKHDNNAVLNAFFSSLVDCTTTTPNELVKHYLARSRFQCPDLHL